MTAIVLIALLITVTLNLFQGLLKCIINIFQEMLKQVQHDDSMTDIVLIALLITVTLNLFQGLLKCSINIFQEMLKYIINIFQEMLKQVQHDEQHDEQHDDTMTAIVLIALLEILFFEYQLKTGFYLHPEWASHKAIAQNY